ncbi:hypothetical protein BgiMline_034025 [Biomphalaria glabrata]|nr:hypothetical protein BgiMline_020230 [Biomphalaria glabrata]
MKKIIYGSYFFLTLSQQEGPSTLTPGSMIINNTYGLASQIERFFDYRRIDLRRWLQAPSSLDVTRSLAFDIFNHLIGVLAGSSHRWPGGWGVQVSSGQLFMPQNKQIKRLEKYNFKNSNTTSSCGDPALTAGL